MAPPPIMGMAGDAQETPLLASINRIKSLIDKVEECVQQQHDFGQARAEDPEQVLHADSDHEVGSNVPSARQDLDEESSSSDASSSAVEDGAEVHQEHVVH